MILFFFIPCVDPVNLVIYIENDGRLSEISAESRHDASVPRILIGKRDQTENKLHIFCHSLLRSQTVILFTNN